MERRIAEAQLWIAQRLPLEQIREKAAQNWGITNIKTISRYLALARQRMVEELISDRRRHQAEQIFALNDCARRAMDAGQFNAAVGAFRVIAEIGGGLTGHALSKDSAAVGNWLTPQRGGCIAAGVRGPFTGKGYNLGIIDDPYKGPEDAKSALERERLIDWLKSVWFTRAEPGLTAEGALLPAAQLWCRPAGTTKR